jgi:hypothetical protein
MTITTDHSLTGSKAAAAISAPLGRRAASPAYYLGRPAQTWIDALSGWARVGSATPANIGRGRPT